MNQRDKNVLYHLHRKGLTDIEIAKYMHYSRSHIGEIRREMGVKTKRGRPRSITKLQVAAMRELYNQGMDCGEIGRQLGMSRHTVYSYVARKGARETI